MLITYTAKRDCICVNTKKVPGMTVFGRVSQSIQKPLVEWKGVRPVRAFSHKMTPMGYKEIVSKEKQKQFHICSKEPPAH